MRRDCPRHEDSAAQITVKIKKLMLSKNQVVRAYRGFLGRDPKNDAVIKQHRRVAKLMVDGGLIVICSFISPCKAERDMIRGLVADGEFLEVFVDTPIEECERRDLKGL
jgi:adenylylsulfate kinase-like enzyme